MAKNKYKTSDLLNLSWEEVNKMSRKELAQITSQLGAIANKRIKRLRENKYYKSSAAYHLFERRGRDKISVRGKSINEVRNQFKLAQQFITAKTSTIKGVTAYRKEVEERLGGKVSGVSEWTEDMWRTFWQGYNKVMELAEVKVLNEQIKSARILEYYRDEIISGISPDDIINHIKLFVNAWREGETINAEQFYTEFDGFESDNF